MTERALGDIHAKNVFVPRGMKIAVVGMVMVALAAALTARLTGQGPTDPRGAPVESRMLSFEEQAGGELVVRDHETGSMVALLPENDDGFIRVVLIGLHRQRAVARVEGDEVFNLVLWDDGRMSLDDPLTGKRIMVSNHGAGNLDGFRQLFANREDNG